MSGRRLRQRRPRRVGHRRPDAVDRPPAIRGTVMERGCGADTRVIEPGDTRSATFQAEGLSGVSAIPNLLPSNARHAGCCQIPPHEPSLAPSDASIPKPQAARDADGGVARCALLGRAIGSRRAHGWRPTGCDRTVRGSRSRGYAGASRPSLRYRAPAPPIEGAGARQLAPGALDRRGLAARVARRIRPRAAVLTNTLTRATEAHAAPVAPQSVAASAKLDVAPLADPSLLLGRHPRRRVPRPAGALGQTAQRLALGAVTPARHRGQPPGASRRGRSLSPRLAGVSLRV